MTSIAERVAELKAAAESIPNIRVYTDPAATVAPPGVVIGTPRLSFESYTAEVTTATWRVIVAVAGGDRAPERLWDLGPAVATAIHEHVDDAVVTSAEPGSWTSGSTELPCYQITVETPITTTPGRG